MYTVIPSPQPGSLSSCPGSVLPLCLWSPDVIIPGAGAWSGRGVPHYHTLASFRSHNIYWAAPWHPHTQRLHYPGHASFIRCNLVWDTEPGSDGWRLIFPGQRHTGRGSGNPRLLMSRWGSRAQPDRQHLLIFHPVHLHNKQETHQVSQPTVLLWFSP